MAKDDGINIKVDTSELVEFAKRATAAQKVTNPVIAASLNEVGDGVVAVMATNLAKDTGLMLEQVRGLMKIKRAKPGDLAYEISVKRQLLEGDPDTLEGKRESKDFGKRNPGALVIIVSKNDDLVCPDCEELQAAGAMPAHIAAQHVPKHPNCRCVILPYVPKGKRLPVTMTTVSGTNPRKRMGGKAPLDADLTLRQMAQKILDSTSKRIRIELS